MSVKKYVYLTKFVLSVITVASIVACNDESGSGSGGAGLERKDITKHMKEFQLRRTEAVGLQGGGRLSKPEVFTKPFSNKNVRAIYLTDTLAADAYLKNTKLHATIRCQELGPGTSSDDMYVKKSVVAFEGPVPFTELVPHEVLYRPHNKSGDSLHCTIGDVYAKDEHDNRFVASTSTSTPIIAPNGDMYFKMSMRQQLAVWSQENPPSIKVGDIEEELRVYSEMNSYGDLNFDQLEIECETFTYREKVIRSSESYFLNFDLRKSRMKRAFKNQKYDRFANQTCRIFAYDQSRLLGFTHYFKILFSSRVPKVKTQHYGPNHYGTGKSGNGYRFSDRVKFAQSEVFNPHDLPMVVSIPKKYRMGRAQFVVTMQGTNVDNLSQGHWFPDSENKDPKQAMHIYRSSFYQMQQGLSRTTTHEISANKANQLSGANLPSVGDSGSMLFYELQPGGRIVIQHFLTAKGCHFGKRSGLKMNTTHGGVFIRPPSYGVHTSGVVVEPTVPPVRFYEINSKLGNQTTYYPGKLVSRSKLPPRYIASTNSGAFQKNPGVLTPFERHFPPKKYHVIQSPKRSFRVCEGSSPSFRR